MNEMNGMDGDRQLPWHVCVCVCECCGCCLTCHQKSPVHWWGWGDSNLRNGMETMPWHGFWLFCYWITPSTLTFTKFAKSSGVNKKFCPEYGVPAKPESSRQSSRSPNFCWWSFDTSHLLHGWVTRKGSQKCRSESLHLRTFFVHHVITTTNKLPIWLTFPPRPERVTTSLI